MTSWFHPNVEKRASSIQGRGLFARAAIQAGETVAVKGGAVMTRGELDEILHEVSPAEIQIEDDLWIAPRAGAEVEANLLCLNHSCDPNVGVRGQITFVAMRGVEPGEELTIDYAMIDGDPSVTMACDCGRSSCRRLVTGDDWRRPELQRRYGGWFSRFLADRIAGLGR